MFFLALSLEKWAFLMKKFKIVLGPRIVFFLKKGGFWFGGGGSAFGDFERDLLAT